MIKDLSEHDQRFFWDIRYEGMHGFEGAEDHAPLFNEFIEDDEQFRSRFQPDRPTIAFSDSPLDGSSLLLMPQVAPEHVNVVGIWGTQREKMYVEGDRLYATEGYVMAENGSVIVGSFEEPVEIDYFEYARMEFAGSTQQMLGSIALGHGVDCEVPQRLEDKQVVRELLEDAIHYPHAHVIDTGVDECEVAVMTFLEATSAKKVVIKPSIGLAGAGVAIFNRDDEVAIHAHAAQLASSGEAVYIEDYIEPFTMPDQPYKDSNIRAVSLGFHGEDLRQDLYAARIADAGGPVNIAGGGTSMHIEQWLGEVQAAGFDANAVLEQLHEQQSAIRAAGIRTFGADYILDKHGKVWAIEVNVGRTGSIGLLAQTDSSFDAVFDRLSRYNDAIHIDERNEQPTTQFEKTHLELDPSEQVRQAIRTADKDDDAERFFELLDSYHSEPVPLMNSTASFNIIDRLRKSFLEGLDPDSPRVEDIRSVFRNGFSALDIYDEDDQAWLTTSLYWFTHFHDFPDMDEFLKQHEKRAPGVFLARMAVLVHDDDLDKIAEELAEYDGVADFNFELLAHAMQDRWKKPFRYHDKSLKDMTDERMHELLQEEMQLLPNGVPEFSELIDHIHDTDDAPTRRLRIQYYAKLLFNHDDPATLLRYVKRYHGVLSTFEIKKWEKMMDEGLADPAYVDLMSYMYRKKYPKKVRTLGRRIRVRDRQKQRSRKA